MERKHTRRFLLQLLTISLLSWGIGAAAQGVNTFEGNGVIEQLYPVDEQIVIGSKHYTLPTEVALKATDRRGAKVLLQPGMLVSFYGVVAGRSHQIQGINFLRWSDQQGTAKRRRMQ